MSTAKMDVNNSSEKDITETVSAKATDPEGTQVTSDSAPKLLDLAFAMDCTSSMSSYIRQAQTSIRQIVEEIVSKETADIRLALVEYRDHPPEDTSFVTRVHDFTASVRDMKGWLDDCSAQGGGDTPEAVADALHQVLKLSWRQPATKICVFISDAPPHGLSINCGDSFPDGCPDGLDPVTITDEIAENSITLYLVGCEPSINTWKEFYMALAHKTGGQYVPLSKANLLPAVISGGAQEELSLQQLMEEVHEEVEQEFEGAEDGEYSHRELTKAVHKRMGAKGYKTKNLQLNASRMPQVSSTAENLSYCTNLADIRKKVLASHTNSYSDTPSRSHRKKSARGRGGSGTRTRARGRGGASEGYSAPVEDVYDVVEEDLAEEQVHRMVQKTLMQKKMRSKTRHEED